ncbi:MAG: gliding motility-associated C-terminal domain-containing protein [Bacteroidales bacterium]
MNNYFRLLIVLFCFYPGLSVHAQIDSVSFDHKLDDLSSYRVIFESFYYSGSLSPEFFTQEDTEQYDFMWDFGDGNTGDLPVMVHSYEAPGIYEVTFTVTAISDPLTTFSAVKQVLVDDTFEVPNVFTPDGDGINDVFIVKSNGVTPLTITIFDRGGSIVYKHTAPVINWDGRTAGGTLVNPGVYYYVITSSEPLLNRNGFFHIYYNH